ncbi:uncharacterized protein LOC134523936 [Chroicocephalus ridibundus]|uniref:uncharacterized protein LOC134523936 n=1 Tax=Chroicocephalus ridibundus TaxID=1192867 RepID=UPI002FDD2B26
MPSHCDTAPVATGFVPGRDGAVPGTAARARGPAPCGRIQAWRAVFSQGLPCMVRASCHCVLLPEHVFASSFLLANQGLSMHSRCRWFSLGMLMSPCSPGWLRGLAGEGHSGCCGSRGVSVWAHGAGRTMGVGGSGWHGAAPLLSPEPCAAARLSHNHISPLQPAQAPGAGWGAAHQVPTAQTLPPPLLPAAEAGAGAPWQSWHSHWQSQEKSPPTPAREMPRHRNPHGMRFPRQVPAVVTSTPRKVSAGVRVTVSNGGVYVCAYAGAEVWFCVLLIFSRRKELGLGSSGANHGSVCPASCLLLMAEGSRAPGFGSSQLRAVLLHVEVGLVL